MAIRDTVKVKDVKRVQVTNIGETNIGTPDWLGSYGNLNVNDSVVVLEAEFNKKITRPVLLKSLKATVEDSERFKLDYLDSGDEPIDYSTTTTGEEATTTTTGEEATTTTTGEEATTTTTTE